jgi:hypothetical protein
LLQEQVEDAKIEALEAAAGDIDIDVGSLVGSPKKLLLDVLTR